MIERTFVPDIESHAPVPDDAPVVIQVQGVHKAYRRYARRLSLRHEFGVVLRQVLQGLQRTPAEPFYALREISFSIRRGEAVGIIGHNGAGKTTLLRVLSGVTPPTIGTVEVFGRFASLIGLGAGFNPDMTGRENIYLNAAFFGWEPKRVQDIEADIWAFSELEHFIDAPVKTYSNGMIARLGFSIAVHILPEIVFLDEVLSVGDARFAVKSRERLLQMLRQNRTVVMVSHAPASVRELCTRVLWLNHGQLVMDGPTEAVLQAYAASIEE